MADAVADLLSFIDRSPTPYHAVAEATTRLRGAGFRALAETDLWDLSPGDRHWVARGDGSHQFSRTLKEHNQAVRKYQLRRR